MVNFCTPIKNSLEWLCGGGSYLLGGNVEDYLIHIWNNRFFYSKFFMKIVLVEWFTISFTLAEFLQCTWVCLNISYSKKKKNFLETLWITLSCLLWSFYVNVAALKETILLIRRITMTFIYFKVLNNASAQPINKIHLSYLMCKNVNVITIKIKFF